MAANARQSRLSKELRQLLTDPVPGCACAPAGPASPDELSVLLTGDADTPYAGGSFRLALHIPPRYPFEPPAMRFLTPILHPNIDSAGRICLDSLKPQPAGAWSPAMSLRGLLLQLRLLLRTPNPDDPLEADLARLFVADRPAFDRRARDWTARYAGGAAAAAAAQLPGEADKTEEEDDEGPSRSAKQARLSADSPVAAADS